MKTYTISQLAGLFGLSRSTLLYYDRIGLLRAPQRTAAGYRIYTHNEYLRLEHICIFRDAGLSLEEVRKLLTEDAGPGVKILEKRLFELGNQVVRLRSQQQLIIAMLKNMTGGTYAPVIDKARWVKMLAAAGMNAAAMAKWHAEFENWSPQAHREFLLFLGIPADEARQIQQWSRGAAHE